MAKELPRYQSHKIVGALQIETVNEELQTKGTATLSFVEEGYDDVTLPATVFARYLPKPGDYYVVYDNVDKSTGENYVSISPRAEFERGYRRT